MEPKWSCWIWLMIKEKGQAVVKFMRLGLVAATEDMRVGNEEILLLQAVFEKEKELIEVYNLST
jgi:hypothetical protein